MASVTSRWGRYTVILYLLIVHLLALLFIMDRCGGQAHDVAGADSIGATAAAVDSATALFSKRDSQSVAYASASADPRLLMIPVVGIKKNSLQDTYTQSRSGGRVHNAIDIMAAGGTPVLAASDGVIAKFFDSKLGGVTIYQWSPDSGRIYYYAHLQRRAAGISEGMAVTRGTIIGYVGDTGDAGPGNYHLHFSISIPASPGKYWGGTDINPYPILVAGLEAVTPGRE